MPTRLLTTPCFSHDIKDKYLQIKATPHQKIADTTLLPTSITNYNDKNMISCHKLKSQKHNDFIYQSHYMIHFYKTTNIGMHKNCRKLDGSKQ